MFSIGDRVRVITERWDRHNFTQYGKSGTVRTSHSVGKECWLGVSLDEPEENSSNIYNYIPDDIELLGPAPLSDQEYHDVFAGQEIYKELEGR